MTKKQKTLPNNIKPGAVDETIAEAILKSEKNYTVRYLRQDPTVGLARIPVRNADGAVIEDAPTLRRRVICTGVPYACLIAFRHDSKLIIGWSKRIADRQLVETKELHNLFKTMTEGASFDEFSRKLVNFLSFQQPKEIEIPFSKADGKTAAIIRGLNDTISFNGNFVTSEASGPIPHEVARNLSWFIEAAETIYGDKASNVAYPDQLPAAVPESAVAVV